MQREGSALVSEHAAFSFFEITQLVCSMTLA